MWKHPLKVTFDFLTCKCLCISFLVEHLHNVSHDNVTWWEHQSKVYFSMCKYFVTVSVYIKYAHGFKIVWKYLPQKFNAKKLSWIIKKNMPLDILIVKGGGVDRKGTETQIC